ncbi:hypothetical protein ACWC9H_27380 [Streptomyces sp. NPDC001251]
MRAPVGMFAVDALLWESDAAALRHVMTLPADAVVDLAAGFVIGEPLVHVAAAMLGDRYVDRYAAARVLGEAPGHD